MINDSISCIYLKYERIVVTDARNFDKSSIVIAVAKASYLVTEFRTVKRMLAVAESQCDQDKS